MLHLFRLENASRGLSFSFSNLTNRHKCTLILLYSHIYYLEFLYTVHIKLICHSGEKHYDTFKNALPAIINHRQEILCVIL